MFIDFRVLEMLSSKVCHDIISPVGAINNGVELIEDIGGSVTDDAMKLISSSATQAARRLRLFRMAYGKAGSEDGVRLRDIRNTAVEYLADAKSKLEWAEDVNLEVLSAARGGLKLLLNAIMLAEEALSHGGMIRVEILAQTESNGVVVTATGSHALLSENARAALDGVVEVEGITPRTVHAYFTGRLAEHYGLSLSAQQISGEKLSLMILPPVKTASADQNSDG